MNALRTESRNEDVNKEMNMPEHIKICTLPEKKRKSILPRTAVRAAGEALLTIFFLCCDIFPFVISSDLLCTQPEPLLCSLDFSSIQYFLLPFGCHLDPRSSLSKRLTAAE